MLRITSRDISPDKTIFYLEGKICQDWVSELQGEITKALQRGRRVVLDFSHVSFLDENAVEMMRQFPLKRVERKNCSLFIRTMLKSANKGSE